MTKQAPQAKRMRTAVLVVHGMGNQRPLETVRGVVNAVWRDNPDNKVWFHPETSGTDIDLTVQTTSDVPLPDGTIPEKNGRRLDFHELYWAHLIAETRAVAVLLWLFELARRGPFLKHGMRPIWWVGAIYLCFLLISVSYLASEIVERLAKVEKDRISMMLTPVITAAIVAALCTIWALCHFSFRLFRSSVVVTAVAIGLLLVAWAILRTGSPWLERVATHFLPAAFALFVARLLMGKFAWLPFFLAYTISLLFHLVKPAVVSGINPLQKIKACQQILCPALIDFVPWSLESPWSSVAAWLFISSYVVLSAGFLQPYLGDVARYLRNSPANVAGRRDIRRSAVDTLLALHNSGNYDRIIVVAHSLGSVVAYDMLRATFARIFRNIPIDRHKLNPEFDRINTEKISREEWRRDARVLMRKLHDLVAGSPAQVPAARIATPSAQRAPRAWLVTDFITLGSPLTHAHYLMWRSPNGKPPKDTAQLCWTSTCGSTSGSFRLAALK